MAIDLALVTRLLGPHPARRLSFDDLRAGLLRNVEQKHVNVSRDGPLELYGYSTLCQFEQKWDLFSLIARGLILDVEAKRVVATPFPKFFNFGEGSIPLPQESFEASEKIDGSLGICFFHDGQWRISTRGDLHSDQGQWATQFLRSSIDTSALDRGTTYLMEIIYLANRIVIPYDFEGLVLLGAYDVNGNELARHALQETADRAQIRIAKPMAWGAFDDLLRACSQLSKYEEGFVIRFQNGLRIKLKGEAYCRLHKLISRCTPLALWEAMMNNEDLEAIRRDLPEEMRRDFDSIRSLLQCKMDSFMQEIREGHERFAKFSDKELGLLMQQRSGDASEVQRKFIFACRNRDFLTRVNEKGESREKLFRFLRPDGNALEGYVPSSAMNRFEQENR